MRHFQPRRLYIGMRYFNPRIPQGMRRILEVLDAKNKDFNPRIPQGMRHIRMFNLYVPLRFQSTHSAGNATLQATEH